MAARPVNQARIDAMHDLHARGYSFGAIANELGCSKATVRLHCVDGLRARNKLYKRQWISDAKNVLNGRIYDFQRIIVNGKRSAKPVCKKVITAADIISKFGLTPICPLTGDKLDLSDPSTYALDHIIPRARGGSPEFDNLRITTPRANLMRGDQFDLEFFEQCIRILRHNGYTVT